MSDRLIAREDQDVSDAVREILEAEGIEIRLDAKCLAVESSQRRHHHPARLRYRSAERAR